MKSRHVEPLPIPQSDLLAMRAELSTRYGHDIWEGDQRILVACVPHDEPDLVNDLEAVVEHLNPGSLDDVDRCLMVGRSRISAVPVDPMRTLLQERLAFDERQCRALRDQMPPKHHLIYKAPEDPARRPRLVVRVGQDSVADLDAGDFGLMADSFGEQLESTRFQEVHCVYLIAGRDHVRLSPQPFYDDLLSRWHDEERRAEVERKRHERESRERRIREAERRHLLGELERRYGKPGERVAITPVRGGPRDQGTATTQGAATAAASSPAPKGAIAAAVDDLGQVPGSGAADAGDDVDEDGLSPSERVRRRHHRARAQRQAAMQEVEEEAGEQLQKHATIHRSMDALRDRVQTLETDEPAGAAEQTLERIGRSADLDTRERLRKTLEEAGFEVLEDPDVPGHVLDLAAERPEGDPLRVIARVASRFTVKEAERLLRTTRELDVDLALAVADAIDPEARRILVATPVKWAKPRDLGNLRL